VLGVVLGHGPLALAYFGPAACSGGLMIHLGVQPGPCDTTPDIFWDCFSMHVGNVMLYNVAIARVFVKIFRSELPAHAADSSNLRCWSFLLNNSL
jgi:hypothetical protein